MKLRWGRQNAPVTTQVVESPNSGHEKSGSFADACSLCVPVSKLSPDSREAGREDMVHLGVGCTLTRQRASSSKTLVVKGLTFSLNTPDTVYPVYSL